jgi:hypothetical protein
MPAGRRPPANQFVRPYKSSSGGLGNAFPRCGDQPFVAATIRDFLLKSPAIALAGIGRSR